MPDHQQLPEDVEEILRDGSRAEVERLLATHALDARDELQGRTLLSFPDLPDDLLIQLVEQGLDVDTVDEYGETPLWARASENRAEQIPLLLTLGADLQSSTPEGTTPLHAAASGLHLDALRVLLAHGADPLTLASEPYAAPEDPKLTPLGQAVSSTNTDPDEIVRLVEISERLLAAGDVITPEMRTSIADSGEEVEDHRGHWEPAEFEKARAAMSRLYEIFDVPPSRARTLHDGISPIVVPPGHVDEQFEALWRLLVPAMGPAATAQGEVIRICDILSDAVLDAPIDEEESFFTRDHALMLKALRAWLGSGTKLSRPERRAAKFSMSRILAGEGSETEFTSADGTPLSHEQHLARLAVAWVRQNPTPLPVGRVKYEG